MPPVAEDFKIKPLNEEVHFSYEIKGLNNATKSYSGKVINVKNLDEVKGITNDLKKHKALAVDCEGVNLGRGGKLTLVQISAKDDTIYVFDALSLGADIFECGLKEILESEDIVKYMYDCRRDSDSLWSEFKVKLNNVFDMQLFEYMCRSPAGKALRSPSKPGHYRRPIIRGMNATVQTYIGFNKLRSKGVENFDSVKEKGGNLMRLERTVWRYRPLSDGLLKYAALDIEMIWLILDSLKEYIPLEGIAKKKLQVASERYAGCRRDFDKPADLYIQTAILPCYIFPVVVGNKLEPFPLEDTKCHGCKRMLIRSCICNNLCEDCKEIERASKFR